MPSVPLRSARKQAFADALIGSALIVVVSVSAVLTKEFTSRRPATALAMLDSAQAFPDPVSTPVVFAPVSDPLLVTDEEADTAAADDLDSTRFEADTAIRWFNGRPVRPARTMLMTVTGYSPDWRSCGDSADDITASNHHVQTNGYHLVAADTRILPLGSMISIPGYATDRVVPVLDRGGAIKGNRLDLLFSTHEEARRWGVKKMRVVVWQYADGKPADDYRKVRDSKN